MRNKIILSAILSTLISVSMPLTSFAADSLPDSATANPTKTPMIESGTIEVDATQVRLLLGGAKGTGVLHYNGQDYKLKLTAGSVGGVGVTKVTATGIVYDLNDIKDFPGTYTGGTVGAVAGESGVGHSTWQNTKGVSLIMTAKTTEGVALNLGLAGVSVEIVE